MSNNRKSSNLLIAEENAKILIKRQELLKALDLIAEHKISMEYSSEMFCGDYFIKITHDQHQTRKISTNPVYKDIADILYPLKPTKEQEEVKQLKEEIKQALKRLEELTC